MKHIVGNPSEFAFEFRQTRITRSGWTYGPMLLWFCDHRLGSLTSEATLNSVLAGLGWWRETIGRRNQADLINADVQTAFFSIEKALYGADHLPPDLPTIPVDDAARFEIFEVDGLERFRIYCVEDEAMARILFDDGSFAPRECRVARSAFTHVMTAAIEWLEERTGRLDTRG